MSLSVPREIKRPNSSAGVYETKVHVSKVSQAKLFESFRSMTKYTHVPLAVIHPTAKVLKHTKSTKSVKLDIEADTLPIKPRINMKREIPTHLSKPVVETNVQATTKIIPVKNMRSESGRPLTLKEKKAAIEEQKK